MKPLESWAGQDNKSVYSLENTFHEDVCPVCGKRFIRMCRRNEWGYWYNGNDNQLGGSLTLLCSGECSKKYAAEKFLAKVRKVAGTKSARAIRLRDGGMRTQDALRAVGLNLCYNLNIYEDEMWKEIDWLREHNWEVPE